MLYEYNRLLAVSAIVIFFVASFGIRYFISKIEKHSNKVIFIIIALVMFIITGVLLSHYISQDVHLPAVVRLFLISGGICIALSGNLFKD